MLKGKAKLKILNLFEVYICIENIETQAKSYHLIMLYMIAPGNDGIRQSLKRIYRYCFSFS